MDIQVKRHYTLRSNQNQHPLQEEKYYVQVRTYKTVSKVNYYSSWSGKKTVVTK